MPPHRRRLHPGDVSGQPRRHLTPARGRPSDRDLVFTRVFDAPRDLVFDAWTDAGQIAAWWGPTGFTTSTEEMDVRPGGAWRFIMHGPDGTDYRNHIVYDEVVRPERLVYHHSGEAGTEPVTFTVTVLFEPRGNRTQLTMRMQFPSAAMLALVAERYGAIEGARQTLARLEAHLAARTTED
jgi:uncharacterized protein YndB with AHSA1/START domain